MTPYIFLDLICIALASRYLNLVNIINVSNFTLPTLRINIMGRSISIYIQYFTSLLYNHKEWNRVCELRSTNIYMCMQHYNGIE